MGPRRSPRLQPKPPDSPPKVRSNLRKLAGLSPAPLRTFLLHPLFTSCECCALGSRKNPEYLSRGSRINAIFPPRSNLLTAARAGGGKVGRPRHCRGVSRDRGSEGEAGGRRRRRLLFPDVRPGGGAAGGFRDDRRRPAMTRGAYALLTAGGGGIDYRCTPTPTAAL